MSFRRRILLGTTALALGGGLAVAGAPTASATPSHSRAAAHAQETTAPKCVLDREHKGRVYTTVWVTNTCKRNLRIKLVMARGADSRCFSIAPRQTRSNKSRGLSPYLDRIVLC